MGPDLQSQILYILLPFEQDAKLSENGLVPIIRCDLNKGPLSDYAIVSDPDVSHQLRKGAGYLTTGRSEILAKVTGPYRYEIDPDRNDFGHIREVELLTPHGIANISKIVGSGLRAHSGMMRPPVPITSAHPFRSDPPGDSGLSAHPLLACFALL